MAILTAFGPIDTTQTNFSWYDINFVEEGYSEAAFVALNGTVYDDIYFVRGADGSEERYMAFLGSDFKLDQDGFISAGRVEAVIEGDWATDTDYYWIEGTYLSLSSVVDALFAGDPQNELNLVASAFRGDDVFNLSDGNDKIAGSIGNDTFMASAGLDTLAGGWGDDFFFAGTGAKVFDGGMNKDTVSYDDADAAIFLDLTDLSQSTGEVLGDKFIDIEVIIGTDFSDTMAGAGLNTAMVAGAGDDHLIGHASGRDKLFGGPGNDLLSSAGNDVVSGGSGSDTLQSAEGGPLDARFAKNAQIEFVFGSDGNDYVRATQDGLFGDTIIVDMLMQGGAGDDSLTGGYGANKIYGGSGNDNLKAMNVSSTLDGGTGADYMSAGAGDDFFFVDHDDDTVSGGSGYDTVYFQSQTGIRTYRIKEVEHIEGSLGNDEIVADIHAVFIDGKGGADTISGAAPGAVVQGGDGNDIILGFRDGSTVFGDDGDDMMATSYDGDDTLFGGSGSDSIDGGRGDDVILGDGVDISIFDAYML